MKSKILVLAKVSSPAVEVREFLITKGFICDVVVSTLEGHYMENIYNYNLCILDVDNLPGKGLEVCNLIKKANKDIPVILLSSSGNLEDKMNAFSAGIDDYLIKPFHLDELFIRVNAVLRRTLTVQRTGKEIRLKSIEIDPSRQTVTREGKTIKLSPKEFKLFQLLAMANGEPVSKQTITKNVWEGKSRKNSNEIEVYIKFLRNKIDKGHQLQLIHTSRGRGYFLKNE